MIASTLERLLSLLGVDPEFADAVLGDLAEEHSSRLIRDGSAAADWWYTHEALRSAPYLLVEVVRLASWRSRAWAAGIMAAAACITTVSLMALSVGTRRPARLVIPSGSSEHGLVVNNLRPFQIPVTVLDSAGRVLPDTGVQYRWVSGMPMPVTPGGLVTCSQPGDAVMHVSLGPLLTELLLRCRPVHDIRSGRMINLVVGDAIDVPFLAVDAEDREVTMLSGQITIQDSSVATVEAGEQGRLVRGRAPGSTGLNVKVGDKALFMSVHVYEPVSTIDGIKPGQHVALPVRLSGAETHSWMLAAAPEGYYVAVIPDGDEQNLLRLSIVGARCVPALDSHSFFCLAQHDATVFVYRSGESNQSAEVRGTLAVWRQSRP